MADDPESGGAAPRRWAAQVAPGASVVEGETRSGKPCRVIDNTGTVRRAELEQLLHTLVAEGHFGLTGLSASGGQTIKLGEPRFTHIQFGESLYRLLLFPYEAVIERF
ncbi:MAG: hypothetical protein GWO02_07570 [Gammaproteobacteria bacterium]|nr:hypothetical protein [Gammaproteobacteria bacterium]